MLQEGAIYQIEVPNRKTSLIVFDKLPSQYDNCALITYSKTCVKCHSKIDKTHILMANGSLMKVKSIAECSPWSILQYF